MSNSRLDSRGASGTVQIVDNSGNVLATTLIYGVGVGPQIGFEPGVQTLVSGSWIQAYGLAVDGSGDLFVADIDNGRVLEEPAGGVERTVASGLSSPYGVALDGAGDIFISEPGIQSVVELPAGGGAQVTLPFTSLDSPGSIAVDTRGDVFVADWWLPYVVELPWMGTGYGPQINVSSDLGQTLAVAVDGAGNVYISTTGLGDIEVPFGCTDSSCQIGLEGCCISLELAVDGIGDLFVPSLYGTVVYEDPANGGAQTTVETGLGSPLAVAADSAGDVFTSQDENGSPPVVELKRSQSAPLSFGTIAYGRTATLPLTMTNIGNAFDHYAVDRRPELPGYGQHLHSGSRSGSQLHDASRILSGEGWASPRHVNASDQRYDESSCQSQRRGWRGRSRAGDAT